MGKSPPATDLQRSRNMSRIKSKDTSIELALRKALWRSGIRYRKNYANLPGKPDIAITKHQIAVFCDGEFWHGKDWTARKDRIHTNRAYWVAKIERNIRRDIEIDRLLYGMGWTVIRFWGRDILSHVDQCINEVKYAIYQSEMDKYYYYDEDERNA